MPSYGIMEGWNRGILGVGNSFEPIIPTFPPACKPYGLEAEPEANCERSEANLYFYPEQE